MKFKLKSLAGLYGYGDDIGTFLDKLEKNFELYGCGRASVIEAIREKASEETVVKVALANIGRWFGAMFITEAEDNKTEKWAEKGEAEYKKHLDKDGNFRYSDFAYKKKKHTLGPGILG